MYWLFLACIAFVISVILITLGCYLATRVERSGDGSAVLILIGGLAAVLVAALVICGSATILVSVSETYELIEKVRASSRKLVILEERVDQYTEEFSVLLASRYPQHEKEVLSKLTQSTLLVYAVKYPQLKSIEGFKLLVKQLAATNDELYKERLKREDFIKDIRFNKVNPWNLARLIPRLPKELQN